MGEIAVIGAGPVGSVVAATLAAADRAVTICEISDDLRSAIGRRGIQLVGARRATVAAEHFAAIHATIDALAQDPPETVFICVKATAIPLVASALGELLPASATVVSWQNGIDTEHSVAESIAPGQVVRAVVNYGVSFDREADAVRVNFEHPPHAVQELVPAGRDGAERVAALLSGAGLDTERAEHLEQMVWKKAILNAALNALCGLTGLNMEEATRDSFAWDLADRVLKESISVARANEIWLGSGFYRWAVDYMHRAGAHRPSMLLDLDAGRRTEIDFINGKIMEYGLRAGIATPYNETMVALVKAREKYLRRERG
ncbi:MAG: 2-dehydropantoate 2-reductase [Alkalispirochaeta sp.]